jgi:hypothetical protein
MRASRYKISFLKLTSFKPKSSQVISPGTRVNFSDMNDLKFVPIFSFNKLNKSFAKIYHKHILSTLLINDLEKLNNHKMCRDGHG